MGLGGKIGTFLGPFLHFGPIWDQVPNSGPYRSACIITQKITKIRALYRRFSTNARIYGHARINTGDLATLHLQWPPESPGPPELPGWPDSPGSPDSPGLPDPPDSPESPESTHSPDSTELPDSQESTDSPESSDLPLFPESPDSQIHQNNQIQIHKSGQNH